MKAISTSSMDSSSIAAKPAASNSFRAVIDNNCNSPRSRPASSVSPWSQIVRGECDATAPTAPSATAPPSESSSPSSLIAEEENAVKKSVWNKPGNGSSSELLGVMGGDSWPALSESARVPSKAGVDSSKGFLENSTSNAPAQVSPDISSVSAIRTVESEAPNLTPNASRQRSFKRNTSHGSTSQTTAPNGDGEVHVNNPPPRERFSHGRGSGDNHQQRNSYRSRGGVTQYNNFGGQTRNFNGNMTSQRSMPRFVRQPPPPPPPLPPSMVASSGPFVVPPPPFGAPIGYSEYQMYYFPPPNMPFYPAALSPVFAPPADHHLLTKIVNQIDYYFSNENLVKDTYLRLNMDDQGWVPIDLISSFKKISLLTDNVQLVKDAVRNSSVVELQGDNVRRQNDWMRWVMPSTVRFGAVVNVIDNLSLNETTALD